MERGRGRGGRRRGRGGGPPQSQQDQQQQQQPPQQQLNQWGGPPGMPPPMGGPMGMGPGPNMMGGGMTFGGGPGGGPMMQQQAMGMMPGMGPLGVSPMMDMSPGGMGFMGGGQMQPRPPFGMGPMGPHMGPFPDQGGGMPGPRPPMGPPQRMGGQPPMMGPRPPLEQRAPQEAPNNDYCQHFVDTGLRPQNYLRDSVLEDRYEEYPKLKRLIEAKDTQIKAAQTQPFGMRADLRKLKLSKETFGTKFDLILIDPPWEEYARRAPNMVEDDETWSWEQIKELEVDKIADNPSFVFLWCGAGAEGLEGGRHCLRKWGFRRCEDICWIKTNRDHPNRKYLSILNQDTKSVLVRTKEHCLMGIRGNVKRNIDGHIIHTNVDTDVIVSEEPPLGSTQKPDELYEIIERFCNGRRRIELFGMDRNMRPGWVTVGKSISHDNYKPQSYLQYFRNPDGSTYQENKQSSVPRYAPTLVQSTPEIEELRPKSPSRGRS